MKITGIICEYNPFHLGHARQIALLRRENPDVGIVCLMSGNYVQRGAPAIFDKGFRAAAAIDCGADLVLELPVTASLSSAEGFAADGVGILGSFCHSLSFGAEDPDSAPLMHTAKVLLSNSFQDVLRNELKAGCSFPAARQKAAQQLGLDIDLISKPNNILAVEYCKAILSQNLSLKPEPIGRTGNYHDVEPDENAPSATAVRELIKNSHSWQPYLPQAAYEKFRDADIHTIAQGEKAILYRLRSMTDQDFEALPYGSEGLWRKLMKNARQFDSLEQIITATKSKRYTRTRLDRMVMCAYLGITAEDLNNKAPYVRVLALNDRGGQILSIARKKNSFPNIGEIVDHPYQQRELLWDRLYGLFSSQDISATQKETKRKLYYAKGETK